MYLLVTIEILQAKGKTGVPSLPPCTPDCPVARAAAIIEGKWTTLIIRDLLGGTKRFGELLSALDGISAKVLTERLKMLEERRLIEKKIYPCIPPRTEYSLTPLGLHLQTLIQAMADFGSRL